MHYLKPAVQKHLIRCLGVYFQVYATHCESVNPDAISIALAHSYTGTDDPIRWRTVDANLELAHLVQKTAWPPWTAPAYKNTQTNMNASNYNTLAIGGILLRFFRSMVSIRA